MKTLSPKTVQIYTGLLKKFVSNKISLDDTTIVVTFITNQSDSLNTRKNYYKAILYYFKQIPNAGCPFIKFYLDEMMKLDEALRKKSYSNEMTC